MLNFQPEAVYCCQHTIYHPAIRRLEPTDNERGVGIRSVYIYTYQCPFDGCRKKKYYRLNFYSNGVIAWKKIKNKQRPAIVKRLALAPESDWVWGCDPETGIKIKVLVR